MRGLIAMILAFPLYYDLAISNHWGAYVCVIALQLLAGFDFKFKEL